MKHTSGKVAGCWWKRATGLRKGNQMTTAEIINRLFRVYPWAVLENVGSGYVELYLSHRWYFVEVSRRGVSVFELSHDGSPGPDHSHATNLRDVLLGKITKYNERNEVVS